MSNLDWVNVEEQKLLNENKRPHWMELQAENDDLRAEMAALTDTVNGLRKEVEDIKKSIALSR